MASLVTSGIGSGLNIQSLVAQLVAAERAPTENRLASREAIAQARISGFGGLKSALEAFQNSVSKLQSASLYTLAEPEPEPEPQTGLVATSGNASLFTATAGENAVEGSYSVEVQSLLSAQRLASGAFADGATFDGKIEIQLGSDANNFIEITGLKNLNGDNTGPKGELADLVVEINAKAASENLEITASIVTDSNGDHLVIEANEPGAANYITITRTGGNDPNVAKLETSDPGYTEISAAQDYQINVDGFVYTNSTSTFDNIDYLPGVTIEVLDAEPGVAYDLTIGPAEEVEATESADPNAAVSSAISAAVNDFVKAYNTLKTTLNDLTAYDAEAKTKGLLNGDPTVRAISSRLRQEISDSVSGVSKNVDTLAELGVTTNPDDGTLEVEADRLSAALESNLTDFETLFSGADGFATRLSAVLEPYTQSAGLIDSRTDGLKSQIERIADRREALNRRLIGIEERYLRQFTALDTLLGELNNSSNFLTSQLANLPGAVPINKN